MILRKLLIVAASVGVASLADSPSSLAQPPASREAASRLSLFDSVEKLPTATSPSDVQSSMPTAAELRQQRALYQTRQRVARLEAAAWLGEAPLRPSWNSIPMMSSRYAPRRIVYVPLYVR